MLADAGSRRSPRTRASNGCATMRAAVADRLATRRLPAADRAVDARGGPPGPVDGVQRFAAELGEFAEDLATAGHPARLPQPRLRVRAARRDDGLGHPAGRAAARDRARAGRVLGGRRAVAIRSPRSGPLADRVRLLHMKDRAAGRRAARRPGGGGDPALPGDHRGGPGGRRRVVRRRAGRASGPARRHRERVPLPRVASRVGRGRRRRWAGRADQLGGQPRVRRASVTRADIDRGPARGRPGATIAPSARFAPLVQRHRRHDGRSPLVAATAPDLRARRGCPDPHRGWRRPLRRPVRPAPCGRVRPAQPRLAAPHLGGRGLRDGNARIGGPDREPRHRRDRARGRHGGRRDRDVRPGPRTGHVQRRGGRRLGLSAWSRG